MIEVVSRARGLLSTTLDVAMRPSFPPPQQAFFASATFRPQLPTPPFSFQVSVPDPSTSWNFLPPPPASAVPAALPPPLVLSDSISGALSSMAFVAKSLIIAFVLVLFSNTDRNSSPQQSH